MRYEHCALGDGHPGAKPSEAGQIIARPMQCFKEKGPGRLRRPGHRARLGRNHSASADLRALRRTTISSMRAVTSAAAARPSRVRETLVVWEPDAS